MTNFRLIGKVEAGAVWLQLSAGIHFGSGSAHSHVEVGGIRLTEADVVQTRYEDNGFAGTVWGLIPLGRFTGVVEVAIRAWGSPGSDDKWEGPGRSFLRYLASRTDEGYLLGRDPLLTARDSRADRAARVRFRAARAEFRALPIHQFKGGAQAPLHTYWRGHRWEVYPCCYGADSMLMNDNLAYHPTFGWFRSRKGRI